MKSLKTNAREGRQTEKDEEKSITQHRNRISKIGSIFILKYIYIYIYVYTYIIHKYGSRTSYLHDVRNRGCCPYIDTHQLVYID